MTNQVIPAEAVEAAAKAIYGLGVPDWHWDERDKELQDLYREDARAALEAAAPYIRAQAIEDAAEGWRAYKRTMNFGTAAPIGFLLRRAAAERAPYMLNNEGEK